MILANARLYGTLFAMTVATGFAAVSNAVDPPDYCLVDIHDHDSSGMTLSWAESLSDNGKYIVGMDFDETVFLFTTRDFAVATADSTSSPYPYQMRDVNDDGLAVGRSKVGVSDRKPVKWEFEPGGGTISQLAVASSPYDHGKCHAVNEDGRIIGELDERRDCFIAKRKPVYWDGPGWAVNYLDFDLSGSARGISDNGDYIVGWEFTAAGVVGDYTPRYWEWNTQTEVYDAEILDSPSGSEECKAVAVNNFGEIIGNYSIDDDSDAITFSAAWDDCVWKTPIALLWDDSDDTDPDELSLSGFDYTRACSINNDGDVVGWAEDDEVPATRVGFLYYDGVMYDLNDDTYFDWESGWVIREARHINDTGDIAAVATYGGVTRAVTLAVPPAPCPGDIAPEGNTDEVVDVLDLLDVLTAWGDASGPADLYEDGIVDVLDLLVVLDFWGLCPCSDEAEPDTLEEAVEGADLDWPDDWDDFVDIMTTGTNEEKDNWNCWMHHYLAYHPGLCLGAACPDDDPFGGH